MKLLQLLSPLNNIKEMIEFVRDQPFYYHQITIIIPFKINYFTTWKPLNYFRYELQRTLNSVIS